MEVLQHGAEDTEDVYTRRVLTRRFGYPIESYILYTSTFGLYPHDITSTVYSEIMQLDLTTTIKLPSPYLTLEINEKELQYNRIMVDEKLKKLLVTNTISLEEFNKAYKIAFVTKAFLDYVLYILRSTATYYIELSIFEESEGEISEPHICIKVYVTLNNFKQVSSLWDKTLDYLTEKFSEDDLEKIEIFFTRL